MKFIYKNDFYRYLRMGLAAGISGFTSWTILKILDQRVFDTSKTIPLLGLTLICVVSGLGIYFLLSILFNLEELHEIVKISHKIGKWKNTLFSVKEPIEPRSGNTGGF